MPSVTCFPVRKLFGRLAPFDRVAVLRHTCDVLLQIAEQRRHPQIAKVRNVRCGRFEWCKSMIQAIHSYGLLFGRQCDLKHKAVSSQRRELCVEGRIGPGAFQRCPRGERFGACVPDLQTCWEALPLNE